MPVQAERLGRDEKPKFIWTSIALFLLSTPLLAADRIVRETINIQGKKRTYYLFVPGSIKSGTPVPLIVLLHGSRRNGFSLVEKWKDIAAREGFIIVGPDSSNSEGWSTPADGPDFLRDLVEKLIANYPINPRRVYLFGHSAGAVFAMNMAMMESEYFAATAVHAGSWRYKSEHAVMDYAKRKPPLAIFIGDRDNFFPLSSVRATEAALKDRGFPIELTVIKGHTHWYYDRAPEINRDAWDFLKRHELTEDPRYEEYASAGDVDEFNAAVNGIDTQMRRANELEQHFHAMEGELRGKDHAKEKDAIAAIAQSPRY
jgi:predicted esterase